MNLKLKNEILWKNELLDEIDDLLDEIYEKLNNENEKFQRLSEEIKNSTLWKVEILLWWEYKKTREQNILELNINSEKILLEKIINSHWDSDNVIFLLLQKSIKDNLPIEWKADPLLHWWQQNEKRQKILREFYLKFLFKSKSNNDFDRNNLKFDFDNLSINELNVFYNRLKNFWETWKWNIFV